MDQWIIQRKIRMGTDMKEKVIVVASGNAGKIREFKDILEPLGYTVKAQSELPPIEEVEETGTTFHDNAILKAQAITDAFGIMAVSDDSGLEIDALDRKPGVYSARWLGHDTPYDVKNAQVLDMLKDVKDRTCRYVCAIAVTRPGNKPVVFEDSVECVVAPEARGTNGFGYDPIFYLPEYGCTSAELSMEEKNKISHRGKALRAIKEELQ